MNLITKILCRLFDHRTIVNCVRDPYLHRWYLLRTARVGVFLHQFIRSDEDRALHDHPWDFLVIPIWRGYIEHHEVRTSRWNIWEKTRVLPILGTRFRRGTYLHTIPTRDRIGLVTIAGEEYVITDIGMRMLEPHELFAAQGFPRDYVIAPARAGRPLPKHAQVRLCGNSVCPPVAAALVRANVPELIARGHRSRFAA